MKYIRGRVLHSAILTLVLTGAFAGLMAVAGGAKSTTPLQVAYAGSMGSMMDGGVRPAIAKALGAELQGRASGSTGLASAYRSRAAG
jgi:molybdate/tungstate transport system substrate-binding protein